MEPDSMHSSRCRFRLLFRWLLSAGVMFSLFCGFFYFQPLAANGAFIDGSSVSAPESGQVPQGLDEGSGQTVQGPDEGNGQIPQAPGTENSQKPQGPEEGNGQAVQGPDEGNGQKPQGPDTEDGQAVQGPEPEELEIPELEIQVSVKNGKYARISWQYEDAVSYQVQRSAKKKGTYKTIASQDGKVQAFTDKSITKGKKYYYRAAAVLEDGTKIYSSPAAFSCPLDKVTGIELKRTSSNSVKVSWKKTSGAVYYRVYCSEKKGDYNFTGITKNSWFEAGMMKTGHKYYFYVQACAAKKKSERDSAMSKAAAIKINPLNRVTVFAGDSITSGLSAYQVLDGIGISGTKNVVADIGLNTTTFRTRRVFNGRTGLEQVIAYQPYRVYLMLGMNEIHYRSSETVAAGYEEIVREIKAGTPQTDIVLLAVSPVTKAERNNRSGFAQIPDLNQRIRKIAQNLGVKYYDYTGFLKDADGCLKTELASSDGVHWTASAYHTFADVMEAYDRSLD